VLSGEVEAELKRLAGDREFPHRAAAHHAMRFRAGGDVADLVAVLDDPHPCGTTEVLFAMAGSQRPWLNWVPMPTEAIAHVADQVGARRAEGEQLSMNGIGLSAAEPPSALTACRRVAGPARVDIAEFPAPDIRAPLRRGKHVIWRYDGTEPVPAVAAPSATAIAVLHEVAAEPWPSLLAGWLRAAPLGELPLPDLLGLLVHLPGPPETPRWQHLATSTPTYWYRLLQPWVCLGLLRHAADEPWETSTRREVLIDLAFGVEDWVSDAALCALVTAAFREPPLREEVRFLVRTRLDAARAAPRLVTIEESLANLMLVTPGCTVEDRESATATLRAAARDDEPAPARKRPWWRKGRNS
jgi:hypothetical protein